jgi:preprotein translocase subunit YajC
MAVYRSMDGVMLLFSLLLVSAAVCVIFLTIQAEVERSMEKKELMETLQRKILTTGDARDSEAK